MRLMIACMYGGADSLADFMSEHGFEVEQFAFYTAPASHIMSKPELVGLYIRTLFKLAVPFYGFRNGQVFCQGGTLRMDGHDPDLWACSPSSIPFVPLEFLLA